MPSVLAIRKSALPSLPENVRKYVGEFFREQEVLGIPCLVASRYTHHPSGGPFRTWAKGMAPSHSVELMRFGRSDAGREVGDEIRAAKKERPEDLFEAYAEEPRYQSIDCD
jgi:hypothetical protein